MEPVDAKSPTDRTKSPFKPPDTCDDEAHGRASQ